MYRTMYLPANQAGDQCFCGNTLKYQPEVADSVECDQPCAGFSDLKCGGGWRNMIYEFSSD